MNTLAINALEEELDAAAGLCRDEGIGIEVTAFAFPATLDGDYLEAAARHKAALAGVSPRSCHGPFLDLYPNSPDPRVVGVATERHRQGLEAAAAVGADLYVAHLNSLPMIRNRRYLDRFAGAAAGFWSEMAELAAGSGITIALENLWEPGPSLQKEVVRLADHSNLKASFDNGHALVFSDVPAADWVGQLGDDLAHVHLHDNDGTADQHRPIGEGIEDWAALVAALPSIAPNALVVLECDRLEPNRRSLAALRRFLPG